MSPSIFLHSSTGRFYPHSFSPFLRCMLLRLLVLGVLPLFSYVSGSMDNYIWYFQGPLTQTCNRIYEYAYNYPLTSVVYQEIHTSLSYNQRNTSGVVGLGYGIPCAFSRSREIHFDYQCDQQISFYPFGYLMYNPDIRYSQWVCLGEESRIARYHASYATITLYKNTNENDYSGQNYRELSCSTVCILGGQQIIRQADNTTVTIQPTKSVLCLRIDVTYGMNDEPLYTMNWVSAEPLPYHLVGATAIYSNGTLFVIGGLRDNYDYSTTSSILEADIDPLTCLPSNWRNYGYSSSSRIGNQQLLHNWSPDNDVLANRTLLWTTIGPPAYPKLPGEYIYDNVPRIYTPSYYPSLLVGGGITIPSVYAFTPSTYSLIDIYSIPSVHHDSYYIPLQYLSVSLASPSIATLTTINQTVYNTSQYEVQQALISAQNPAIIMNLNLPPQSSLAFEYITLLDSTMRSSYKSSLTTVPSLNQYREYRWLYYDGTYMYHMDTNGDMLNPWQRVYNEIILNYDNGDYNSPKDTIPTGANLFVSFIGKSKDSYIIGTDYFTFANFIGYSHHCNRCETGRTYSSQQCKRTPYEGVCSSCTVCSPFNVPPTYRVASCTRETNTKCAKCTQCLGGAPLLYCNFTTDAECNPELEALMLQPKWKRVPILVDYDFEYVYIISSIIVVWLTVGIVYNIHKTQLNFSKPNTSSTGSGTVSPTSTNHSVTFKEIISSPLFRRHFLSLLHTTSVFLWGTLTIITYIYFNYAVLSTVLKEEMNSTMVFGNPSLLYMGNLLRDKIKILSVVTLCSLFFSILFNSIWLVRYYRSVTNIPFVYYIVLPLVSLHYHLSVGFYKLSLASLHVVKPVPNKASVTPNEAYRFLFVIIHGLAVFCSDGMIMIQLLALSDMFSATISGAYPLAVGVALCGLMNILVSIYKVCLLYGNRYNPYQPHPVLKNEGMMYSNNDEMIHQDSTYPSLYPTGSSFSSTTTTFDSTVRHNPINKQPPIITTNSTTRFGTEMNGGSSLVVSSSSSSSVRNDIVMMNDTNTGTVPSVSSASNGITTYSLIPLSTVPVIPLQALPSSAVPYATTNTSSHTSNNGTTIVPMHYPASSPSSSSSSSLPQNTATTNTPSSVNLLERYRRIQLLSTHDNGLPSNGILPTTLSPPVPPTTSATTTTIRASPSTTGRLLHNHGFTYTIDNTITGNGSTNDNITNTNRRNNIDYTTESVSDMHTITSNDSNLDDGSNTLYDITL